MKRDLLSFDNRDHFFGQSPQLDAFAQGRTHEQIDRLKRDRHDLVKTFANYHAATQTTGECLATPR